MNARLTLDAVALIAAAIALGGVVTYRPQVVARLDERARLLCFGRGTKAAIALSALGYTPALTVIFLLIAAATAMTHGSLRAAAGLGVAQLACQWVVHRLKAHFKRPRPERWLHLLEGTAAYPSGHAASAALIASGCAMLAHGNAATLPTAIAISAAVGWSRIVLGAHYLTDVIGGYLLGGAAALLWAAFR